MYYSVYIVFIYVYLLVNISHPSKKENHRSSLSGKGYVSFQGAWKPFEEFSRIKGPSTGIQHEVVLQRMPQHDLLTNAKG